MRLYRIRDEYYELLHKHDSNVLFNKNEKRPYVGVVLKIDDYNYYIPLSSPKPKHQLMKNNKDFIKLGGGRLGALNINCMIPVDTKNLIKFDIEKEEYKYRDLLRNQLVELKSLKETIIRNAQYIYTLHNTKKDELTLYQKNIIKRCCNFKQLENICYNQSYEKVITNDLIKNHLTPTKKLVESIGSLSCSLNSFQSLSDIINKYNNSINYFNDVQSKLKEIVLELGTQELKRQSAITKEY